MKYLLSCVAAMALLIVSLGASNAPAANTPSGATIATTGQLLAYQQGFLFFTTGDGFRVSPNVAIINNVTHRPTKEIPRPRLYARAVFNPQGVITEIDLSKVLLPAENIGNVGKFAVALSSPVPNPDLIAATPNANNYLAKYSGKLVLVSFTVQVPPNTPPNAQVYISTASSSWNPQAIPMQRIDILHFQIVERLRSGTILRYVYTRGSLQSIEVGQNGLSRPPRVTEITDADARAIRDIVFNWADTSAGNQSSQPNAIPTPYNPVPFPNLPPGAPTPHA